MNRKCAKNVFFDFSSFLTVTPYLDFDETSADQATSHPGDGFTVQHIMRSSEGPGEQPGTAKLFSNCMRSILYCTLFRQTIEP